MPRTREERRKDFEEFYNSAKTKFTKLRDNDPEAEKFERIYMLCVCPGSRAGGDNYRVVEVFWGSRPFETITRGNSWKALSEYGATLLYERDDNGYVIVSLYPAGTENRKPVETSLSLKLWVDPIKLKNERILQKHWNDLMAYMECTSLDGHPTFWQKQRVSYLRYFNHLVVDNTWNPTKFSLFLKSVFKTVVTVVFSGAVLIYLITQMTQPSPTDRHLKELSQQLQSVSTQLDKIAEGTPNLTSISTTVDSILENGKEILRVLSK